MEIIMNSFKHSSFHRSPTGLQGYVLAGLWLLIVGFLYSASAQSLTSGATINSYTVRNASTLSAAAFTARTVTNLPVARPVHGKQIDLDAAVVCTNETGAVRTVMKFTLFAINIQPGERMCSAYTDFGPVVIYRGSEFDAHANEAFPQMINSLKAKMPAAIRRRQLKIAIQ
jgi:hypothetical protein